MTEEKGNPFSIRMAAAIGIGVCMLVLLAVFAMWPDSKVAGTETMHKGSVRGRVDTSGLPYEESLSAPIEEGVKKVDFALIKGLNQLGLHRSDINLKDVENRTIDGHSYHYQRLAVHFDAPHKALLDTLNTSLATWAPTAELLRTSDTTYTIAVDNIPTHELAVLSREQYIAMFAQDASRDSAKGDIAVENTETPLTSALAPAGTESPSGSDQRTPYTNSPDESGLNAPSAKGSGKSAAAEIPSEQATPKARLAIVIDDLGESVRAAKTLAELDFPVTFAIWPRASHTTEVASVGRTFGEEIMIHQPMEPMGYPDVKPGPGCVYVNMTPDQIHTVVAENLKLVPDAVGMNNHMGSAFTQNKASINAVLTEVNGRSLFILDSLTHSKSVFFDEAKAAGIPSYRRNVFIDVIADVQSIVYQLEKAERIALAKGQAIAIGHPLPETLDALKEWATHRNPAVEITTVRSLKPFVR